MFPSYVRAWAARYGPIEAISNATSSKVTLYVRPVMTSPIWTLPIGVVPQF